MPILMDYLCMATPFIGIIRLACLQLLLNFAAIDGLHLRETDTTKKPFDHCGYRIEKLEGQFSSSTLSHSWRPTSRSMYGETDRFHLSYAETVYATVGLIKWNLNNASKVSN
jgi:hypothetical protein